MASYQQAVDGRQALAWILEPKAGEVTSLTKGDIVMITKKKSASSAFGNVAEFKPFIAKDTMTLTGDDKCIKLLPHFMGFAKDKTLNKSKNTVQTTTDYDEKDQYVSDGIVNVSGSISGSFMIEGAKYATTMLKRRFGDVIDMTGETVTVLDAETAKKDLIMLVWNGRDAKVGDVLEIEIVPALLTSLAIGGSYGSSQTFNIDFSGNATDENGYQGATLHVPNSEGLLPKFTRAGADQQAIASA